MLVDVGVVAGRSELHHGRGVRISAGEGERQPVVQSLVGGPLGARYGGHPVEQIVSVGERGHTRISGHLVQGRKKAE